MPHPLDGDGGAPANGAARTLLKKEPASRAVPSAAARTAGWRPGQRVVNEAELALGLGCVVRVVDRRNVEIYFGSIEEVRVYNVRTAPLKRLRLRPGQVARLRDGRRFHVEKILRNADGLLVYRGEGQKAVETALDDVIPAAEAVDKLQTGHLSPPRDYALRLDGWRLRQSFLAAETRGLVGARIRPLGHQLYIAHKIAHQEVARVLLADEVGLGKTIEAGLIFSALRSLGRATRVLILTPPSLVHQWMAEMYRKFNEMFTVLSEERCAELDESKSGGDSPFEAAPRVICSTDVLLHSSQRLHQAAQVQWDLLIVDEAHHLRWSDAPNHEQASDPDRRTYAAVQMLSQRSNGLLLLTATPARDGLATEFGLLRLVDPDRFNDFPQFERERDHMKQAAEVAAQLAGDTPLPHIADRLLALYPVDDGLAVHGANDDATRQRLLRALIDRHGTGRVLVRNRRERLHGFQARILHAVPLRAATRPTRSRQAEQPLDPSRLTALPADARPDDPRVDWLLDTVRGMDGEKVVLICASERIVHMLARVFRERTALKVAVFHEGLSIVERDRQAAWFAEPDGAVILLCSEIGGEGRNFQFSHNLILFDLPLHPDLVEQRIGRLDRIGQEHPVHIHIPYLADTQSEALMRWHRDALQSFERPVNGAEQVMLAMHWQLGEVLKAFSPSHPQFAKRESLLADLNLQTQRSLAHVREAIQESVDFLVDLNSYDEIEGQRLIDQVHIQDADPLLAEWMSRVFDRFGVVEEQVDTMGRLRIHAGEMMFVDVFPGLPNHDMGATYRRTLALAREELQFLSQDHPLVEGALGLMLDGDAGRAAVCVWEDAGFQTVLLQCLFVLDTSGPPALELHRFVPITPIEVIVDGQGELRGELDASLRGAHLGKAAPEVVERMQPLFRDRVPALLDEAQAQASRTAQPVVAEALDSARRLLNEQQQRLIELRRINPTLPQSEVEHHARKMAQTLRAIEAAEVHLDALRVIVVTP